MLLLVLAAALFGSALVLALRAVAHRRIAAAAVVSRVAAYTNLPVAMEGPGFLARLRQEEEGPSFGLRRGYTQVEIWRLRLPLLAVMALVWVLLWRSGSVSLFLVVLGTLVSLILAWRYPEMRLKRLAEQRVDEIDRELPALVDLLVVAIEAGVGLGASLQVTSEQVRGPLREELKLVAQEQQMGLTTQEALRNLARRCPTPAVSSFVRAVSQGERFGVSIAKTMRELAVDMRKRRQTNAEERAQKAPVKMLFPLVFLIFPSLLVILMGPGLIDLLRALKG